MEELTPILEQLAEKLGTTTDYLWAVLLKQAPISAATNLLYFVLLILVGVVMWKTHRKASLKVGGVSAYDELSAEMLVFMIFMLIIWAARLFWCLPFSLNTVVAGFLNPEYWALSEVMSLIN